MTVSAEHCKYLPKDDQHWNGIRVGMFRNNSKNEIFVEFARKKGFTFKPVYFDRSAELSESLQIRLLDGTSKNMPIILVTAYDTAHVVNDAHIAGVNKVIQKPLFQSTFFYDQLFASISKLIKKEEPM